MRVALPLPLIAAGLTAGLLAGCEDVRTLDQRGDATLVQTARHPGVHETDEPPAFSIAHLRDDSGARDHLHALPAARAALLLDADRVLLVDTERRLLLRTPKGSATLLDTIVGAPARLQDGRVIAARETEPGESDLWVLDPDAPAKPPRALAASEGSNELPFVLADGRVLFVSGRTGVAALFVVDPAGGEPTQLTNRNARPGALGTDFVPVYLGDDPPTQEGDVVTWRSGDDTFTLDVLTGRVAAAGVRR
jgi:hypothetical protein